MPRTRAPYAAVFWEQMVELVRSGLTPAELAREFELDRPFVFLQCDCCTSESGKTANKTERVRSG